MQVSRMQKAVRIRYLHELEARTQGTWRHNVYCSHPVRRVVAKQASTESVHAIALVGPAGALSTQSKTHLRNFDG